MDGSIGFSTNQSVGNYPKSSFTFQNKFIKKIGTAHNFFFQKKVELHEFKNKEST